MIRSAIVNTLKESFLFEGLSDAELDSLAQECRVIERQAGEILFYEGDPATYFYFMLDGQIQAYKTSGEGKEMILHLFHPGDIFAEFPVFEGAPTYPASAMCLKDTRVLGIHGEGFKRLAVNKPEILLKVLTRLAQRLRYFTGLVEDLSLRNVDARLAKYLLTLSKEHPHEAAIEVHKKTLAAILGTVPETLSRSFKRLSREGMIMLSGSMVRIRDRQALEDLSEVPEGL